jgi:tetratricopeptide (TPR) repeat protein
MIFLAAKRRDWAIKAFQRGLVYAPENVQLTIYLAQTFLDDGQADKALTLAESLIRQNPQGREAFDLLAQALISLKREKEILPRLETAAKQYPKNVPLQYALVDRYRAQGMSKEADALTNKLIDIQPDLQGFPNVFATLLKGKKTEELLRLLEKVAGRVGRVEAVDPQLRAILNDSDYTTKVLDAGIAMLSAKPAKLSEAGYAVLRRLATLGRQSDKTIDLIRMWLTRAADPQGYQELAYALAQAGKNEEAVKTVEELFQKYPNERNPSMLVLLAQLRLRSNQEGAAIAALREALKIDPRFMLATRLLAFSLSSQGKTDEALGLVREGLRNSPTDLELNGTYGGILTGAGRDAEAISFWKGLIEKYPNNDELVRIARSSLSVIYTNQGDFAKGEAELEILYAKNPDEPGVNNDLGYLYADQGKNLEKAEEMIRKAVAEESDNSAYLDSLGWVLFKRGKLKESLSFLEKAIQNLQSDDATIHDHLGQVYFELKDWEKAKSSWEKAEKIAAAAKPPDKKLSDIRKKLKSLEALKPKAGATAGVKP